MARQFIPTHVLVVDDDEMSRELLSVLLEGEGYAVESADSGKSALALLRQNDTPPDLVLADLQMPGRTGARLARDFRCACGPKTLLLAMSGSRPSEKTIAPYDGFLLKPFKIEEIAAAFAAHSALRQSKSEVTAASASKPASKRGMEVQAQTREIHSPEPFAKDSITGIPVLNETIYGQLASSMPAKQLHEMYAMCVDDARIRIAGMRRLADAHDAAMFVREAHAIKGGCGMLGATELHRMADELEKNGLESAGSRSPEVNSLDELSAACDRLERMLGSRV